MFLLLAMGAVAALCAVLWRVAVYALPVFIGVEAGWYALSAGAGVVALLVGLVASAGSWLAAKHTYRRGPQWTRLVVAIVFGLTAAAMGLEIVWQISDGASLATRIVLGSAAALAAGGTSLVRLVQDHQTDTARSR